MSRNTAVRAIGTRNLLAAADTAKVRKYVQQSMVLIPAPAGDRWVDESENLSAFCRGKRGGLVALIHRTVETDVLTDPQLIELAGPNGRVRCAGCSTHLGHGRSMEGFMGVQSNFAYVLRPEQL